MNGRIRRVAGALVALACLACVGVADVPAADDPAGGAAASAMTNADVIKLVRLGLGTDLVVEAIRRAARPEFRLDTAGLAALKEAGVADDVIRAMFARTPPPPPPPPPAQPAPPPAAPPAAPNAAVAPPAGDVPAQCAAHFGTAGTLLRGRVHRSWIELPCGKDAAFEKVLAAFAKAKLPVTSKDRAAGVVHSKDTPLTDDQIASEFVATVSETAGGRARVDLEYHQDAGTIAHYDVQKMLCGVLERAQ